MPFLNGLCTLNTRDLEPGKGGYGYLTSVKGHVLSDLVVSHAPDCAAVESSCSGRNPRSSLSLAESRGVVLAVLGRGGIPVHSYTPAQVKLTIVGHGRAEKQQIVYMVVRLLSLAKAPALDAADAMAVALTHLHTVRWR